MEYRFTATLWGHSAEELETAHDAIGAAAPRSVVLLRPMRSDGAYISVVGVAIDADSEEQAIAALDKLLPLDVNVENTRRSREWGIE